MNYTDERLTMDHYRDETLLHSSNNQPAISLIKLSVGASTAVW